jgi:predicted SAM-dependent methyltransferase
MTWLAIGATSDRPAEHGDIVTLDIRPGVAMMQGDVRCMPCFFAETFEGVELHHVLEHLERDEAPGALREIWRVLKPGGELHISTPDMLLLAEDLLHGNTQLLINIYSPDTEPAQHHRWGYTPDTMRELLRECGFVDIEPASTIDGHGLRFHCKKGSVCENSMA